MDGSSADLTRAAMVFVQASLRVLDSLTHGGSILPTRRAPDIRFAAEGSARTVSAMAVPSWDLLASQCFVRMLGSSELEAFKEVASRYPPVREAVSRSGWKFQGGWTEENVAAAFEQSWIPSLLQQYLLRAHAVTEFRPDVFEEAFEALVKRLRGDFAVRYFAGVFRLQIPGRMLEIGDVRIRVFEPEERAKMYAEFEAGMDFSVEKLMHGFPFDSISLLDAKHLVELDLTAVQGSWDDGPVRRQINDLVTSLRFLRDAGVYLGPIYINQIGWLQESTVSMSELLPIRPAYGPDLALHPEDMPALTELTSVLAGGVRLKRPALDLAIERYERAVGTREPRDRLLDTFIGLEALLLRGSKDEKSFRLSVRAAHLVGDSPERRQFVATLLKKGYGIRSALVHGDIPKGGVKVEGVEMDLTTLAREVMDVLRESIKRVLLQPELHDPLVLSRVLDRRILGLNGAEIKGPTRTLPDADEAPNLKVPLNVKTHDVVAGTKTPH